MKIEVIIKLPLHYSLDENREKSRAKFVAIWCERMRYFLIKESES